MAKTYQKLEEWDLAFKELGVVEKLPKTHQSDLKHKQEAKQLQAKIEEKRK